MITVRIDAREEAEKFLADVGLDLRAGWRMARYSTGALFVIGVWCGIAMLEDTVLPNWAAALVVGVNLYWGVLCWQAHQRVKDVTP